MQKWEYLVVYIQGHESSPELTDRSFDVHASADKYTEQLNKFASGGWELMQFEWDGDKGVKVLFKRPRG